MLSVLARTFLCTNAGISVAWTPGSQRHVHLKILSTTQIAFQKSFLSAHADQRYADAPLSILVSVAVVHLLRLLPACWGRRVGGRAALTSACVSVVPGGVHAQVAVCLLSGLCVPCVSVALCLSMCSGSSDTRTLRSLCHTRWAHLRLQLLVCGVCLHHNV